MVKGIIFDCDGVIIDSEDLFSIGIRDQLAQYNLSLTDEQLNTMTGQTGEMVCKTIMSWFPDKFTKPKEQLIKEYYDYTNAILMNDDLVPMEGIQEFVKDCHEKGLKMAVASSSNYEYVIHKLRLFKIDQYFDEIVTCDDITHSKPHPEIYQKAIEKLNLPAQQLIAIEDAPNGIRSAQGAGLYCVGFKGSKLLQDTSIADEEVYAFNDIKVLKEK